MKVLFTKTILINLLNNFVYKRLRKTIALACFSHNKRKWLKNLSGLEADFCHLC